MFIPEVNKRQKSTGSNEDVFLIIDNAPSHLSETLSQREDEKFNAIFLPFNVTSILQPMYQGVIEAFKRYYRKHIIRMLLLGEENNEDTILQLYKK